MAEGKRRHLFKKNSKVVTEKIDTIIGAGIAARSFTQK